MDEEKQKATTNLLQKMRLINSRTRYTMNCQGKTTIDCVLHNESDVVELQMPVSGFVFRLCCTCWENEMKPSIFPANKANQYRCQTCCAETPVKRCIACQGRFCVKHYTPDTECCSDCTKLWETDSGQYDRSIRGS